MTLTLKKSEKGTGSGKGKGKRGNEYGVFAVHGKKETCHTLAHVTIDIYTYIHSVLKSA